MASSSPDASRPTRAPVHLWIVGILLVLWNSWGLLGALAVQFGSIPDMPAEAAEYFARQPLWFIVFADLSPLAGVAGSIALLVQSRWAQGLFAAQITVLVLANLYELAAGTSLLLGSGWAIGSTVFLLAMLAGELLYAGWMRRRGVLS